MKQISFSSLTQSSRVKLGLCLATLLISVGVLNGGIANAQSESTLIGKYYQDGHLAITSTFDAKPDSRCRIDLYAKLSNVKNSDGDIVSGSSRVIGRIARSSARRVRFTTSKLPRLQKTARGTSDSSYPQINLQTKSRCPGVGTITSSVVAIPLKCGDTKVRTATSGKFLAALDASLKGD